MRCWLFDVVNDTHGTVLGAGYVRARCVSDALQVIGREDAQLYPVPD